MSLKCFYEMFLIVFPPKVYFLVLLFTFLCFLLSFFLMHLPGQLLSYWSINKKQQEKHEAKVLIFKELVHFKRIYFVYQDIFIFLLLILNFVRVNPPYRLSECTWQNVSMGNRPPGSYHTHYCLVSWIRAPFSVQVGLGWFLQPSWVTQAVFELRSWTDPNTGAVWIICLWFFLAESWRRGSGVCCWFPCVPCIPAVQVSFFYIQCFWNHHVFN